jgi:hypothetical protein
MTRFAPRLAALRSSSIRLLAATAALALAACGGSSPAPAPGGGGGGGGATATSKGVVTALGSVTVNGIRFDTSTAQIRIDDNPGRPESELKLGMVVKVKGSKDDAAGTGKATEVEAHHVVRGRVDDKGGSVLKVGGHEVEIEHATEFEDHASRLGSIAVGERVRVHGHPTTTGHFRATRVEKESGTSEDFEVKGFVSDLARTTGTFTLKVTPDAASSYAVTMAAGAAMPGGILDGSYVDVRSASAPVAGALTAASVALEDARLGEAQAEVEVEGLVTSGSSAQFSVEGQSVATSASTRWENGLPGDLAPGVKVEAEGKLDASNVLQATKVSFRANVRLQGAVSSVVAASAREGTFQVLGTTVRTDAWTEWKSSGGGSALDLTTIGTGPVLVRGVPGSSGEIVATRVESTNDARLVLQGPVATRNASGGTLSVLGLTIQTNAQTEYRDASDAAMTATAFFAAVVEGKTVVKARSRDPLSGTTFTAEQIEIEGSR